MNKWIFCTSLLGLIVLNGCFEKMPSCSDRAVTNLVTQLITQRTNEIIDKIDEAGALPFGQLAISAAGWTKEKVSFFRAIKNSDAAFSYSGIGTQGKNDELKTVSCRAQLTITANNKTQEQTIYYNAQLTDDNMIYVEVPEMTWLIQ